MKEVRGLSNELRSSLRSDRENYWSSNASIMEAASARSDMSTLFKFVRSRQNGVSEVIHDANGAVITDLKAKKELWKHHFESLLNRQQPANRPSIPFEGFLEEHVEHPPTLFEVKKAVQEMSARKAPGESGIPVDFWKKASDDVIMSLVQLYSKI